MEKQINKGLLCPFLSSLMKVFDNNSMRYEII